MVRPASSIGASSRFSFLANLTAKERRELSDRAFAYIDGEGTRRLPINDEGHVRAALARALLCDPSVLVVR